MNNEDELIKLAKTRRAMGYSMWPGTCSKCGNSFEAGRHLVEDAKVYSYCNNCYDELEKLVRTGINDVFIQPERSKREDYILHLRCEKCQELDLVFTSKAKEWKCPHCIFRCGALNSQVTD